MNERCQNARPDPNDFFLMATHKDLARKLADMEKKYDTQFKVVFDAIRQLVTPQVPKKKKIGFKRESE